jgi:hypothetical protein
VHNRTTHTLTQTFLLSCSNPPHQLVLVMVPFWHAPVQIRPTPVCHALIHTHEYAGINTYVSRAYTYIQIQIQIRIHIRAYTLTYGYQYLCATHSYVHRHQYLCVTRSYVHADTDTDTNTHSRIHMNIRTPIHASTRTRDRGVTSMPSNIF